MKKNLLFSIVLLAQLTFAQNVKFNDADFKAHVVKYHDLNDDNEISIDEAKKITQIGIEFSQIQDFTGLEQFINLNSFVLRQSAIIALDFSKNPSLEAITIDHNDKLEQVNIKNCVNLKSLNCNYTLITELDLDDNINLENLYCDHAQLNSIDITSNTKLKHINFNYCKELKELNVSNNPDLEYLSVIDNKLQEIDLSNNIQLSQLTLDGNQLTTLDLSNNPSLGTPPENVKYSLSFVSNPLETLILKNGSADAQVYDFYWKDPESNNFVGMPLKKICIDEVDREYVEKQLKQYNIQNTSIVTDCDGILGVADFEIHNEATIFLNPKNNILSISPKNNTKVFSTYIYNTQGQLLIQGSANQFDLSPLSQGIYIIQIDTNKGSASIKIIKH